VHDQSCRREGGAQPLVDLGRDRPLRLSLHCFYIAGE
jgi:hypothetical protein